MRLILLPLAVFLGVATVGCSSDTRRELLGIEVAELCPADPAAQFFPIGLFGNGDWKQVDEFVRGWYSYHLSAMQEPPLSCGKSQAQESYRFVWLRTFDNPIAVRVNRFGKDVHLEAVVLNGQGGYDAGQVSQRVSKRLAFEQWEELLIEAEAADFWHLPATADDQGFDGAQWIIEGRKGDRYHLVDRWSGSDGVQRIGLKLLELADLTNSVGPIY